MPHDSRCQRTKDIRSFSSTCANVRNFRTLSRRLIDKQCKESNLSAIERVYIDTCHSPYAELLGLFLFFPDFSATSYVIPHIHRLHPTRCPTQAARAPGTVRRCARRVLAAFASRQALAPERVVVLSLGNVRWGDAGIGVHALERLKARWEWPVQVEFVAGDVRGRMLLPVVESTQRLIVLTALDFGLGLAPGALRVVTGDAAADYLYTQRDNLPGMGFAGALACAQLNGRSPREIVLIGVQVHENECYGACLSSAVHARLDPAVDAARRWLRRWRAAPLPRPASAPGTCTPAVAPCGERCEIDAPLDAPDVEA